MNQSQKKIVTFIFAMVIGLILVLNVPMAYFIGLILSFIILFGQNHHDVINIGKTHSMGKRVDFFPIILVGYLIAGIISFFI